MADDYSIFGQLTGLNSSGKARDAKEVPVDRQSRRKARGKKRKPRENAPRDELEQDLKEDQEDEADRTSSGKVVDIIV